MTGAEQVTCSNGGYDAALDDYFPVKAGQRKKASDTEAGAERRSWDDKCDEYQDETQGRPPRARESRRKVQPRLIASV